MSTTDPTINIPQLILVVAVTIFVVRYLFFSSGDGSPGDTAAAARGGGASSSAAANGGGNRAREADVERVQQMFPQIARRDIMWDLQRNGGNVVATTERVLSGRGLEMPPQTFQPALPAPASTSPSSSSAAAAAKALQPDLITRYNLQAKIAEEAARQEEGAGAVVKEETPVSPPTAGRQRGGKAWENRQEDRQALMQKRKEDMVLAARRKMQARLAADAKPVGEGQ